MVEDKKEAEEKKEEEHPEIVLKVDMHCEGCARKVARTLKGFEGVEEVATDSKANKVVVKGKTANPSKVYERLVKKYGRKVELVSPLPKPPPPPPATAPEEEKKEDNKEANPKEEEKQEPPAVITVELKVGMHCEACAQVLRKRIRKIKGVESVVTDVANDKVTVKGTVNPTTLVDYVYKGTGKQASIVKGEEKKEQEKPEGEASIVKGEEKKEQEKPEGEEVKAEELEDDKKSDVKYYSDFEYAPQFFSEDNPNACSVM